MKYLAFYILLLFPLLVDAQKDSLQRFWEQESKRVDYRKDRKFKGPQDWYSYPEGMDTDWDEFGEYYPADADNFDDFYIHIDSTGKANDIREVNPYDEVYEQESFANSLPYDSMKMVMDRQQQFGDVNEFRSKSEATVEELDPFELPEIEEPDLPDVDIDLPDVDLPDVSVPQSFWKSLLYIILFILALWGAYILIKRMHFDKKIQVKNGIDVENEWNPEVITKSELEQKLELAIANEDYRQCVRVYFTFILKELIKRSWIKWERDKTNHDYINEMVNQSSFKDFAECVRIYDLVWYGDYQIDRKIYQEVQPKLEAYYNRVNQE